MRRFLDDIFWPALVAFALALFVCLLVWRGY